MNQNSSERVQQLKKFSVTMFVTFGILALLTLRKHHLASAVFAVISLAMLGARFLCIGILDPIEKSWMKLANMLGWVNTRLLLSIIFFFVFTPIRIILSLLRKDLLMQTMDRNSASYWIKKEKQNTTYERLF